jgi:hypothetical protein
MIGSWSNRIIEESRCHMRDRHALDKSNRDVNYVALALALTGPGDRHVTRSEDCSLAGTVRLLLGLHS